MEEKKKVFIRGRKDRGQEVIDILTGLGATNANDINCENKDYIYFIDHRNKISYAYIDSELGGVVMDNYREIELPKQLWKDGDILITDKYGTCYAVFKIQKFHQRRNFRGQFSHIR